MWEKLKAGDLLCESEGRFKASLRPEDKFSAVNQNKLKRYKDALLVREELVKGKQRKFKAMRKQFNLVNSGLKQVGLRLKEINLWDTLMESAAVKIQKVFRGFILRKSMEAELLEAKRVTNNGNMKEMGDGNAHLIFDVGKMPEKSANIIKKAYKRYKLRLFYYRLIDTYRLLQSMREEENYKTLRERLRCLYSICTLKQAKFECFRRRRLFEIRINLALLAIKKNFKRLKLKKAIIMTKIKTYKRRLRAALKRRNRKRQAALAQLPEGAELPEIDTISMNSEEDFETTTSDREAEERAQFLQKLEAERQQRIHFGKIAYNCRELKLPKILTTLHQKEVMSSESPATVNVKKKMKRMKIKKEEFDLPRRHDEEPSYMRATISFNLGKVDCNFKEEPRDYGRFSAATPRDNSTIFKPTKAYLLKVTEKRSLSIDDGVLKGSITRADTASFISVSIKGKNEKSKQAAKIFARKKQELVPALPEISTRHQNMTVNVKPRTEIMKGFVRTKRKFDSIFEF